MRQAAPVIGAARKLAVLIGGLVALIAAFGASIALGSVDVPLHAVRDGLLNPIPLIGNLLADPLAEGPYKQIVQQIRLPVAVEGVAVGASLGIAGAVLQAALANPLASPDVIGVTAGAGFGATLILLAFPASAALLPLGALGFGFLAALIVFSIAWSGPNRGATGRVILAGIAVAAMFGAGTTTLMTSFPDRVQSVIFFLAGGLTPGGWDELQTFWPYITAGLITAVVLIRPLDRLSLGDEVAASLGSRPALIRLASGIAAALLASAAAAIAGLLAFVGLVVPHLVRMLGGSSANGYVIPVSGVVGAALLTAGDVLARVIAAPLILPVGPFMVILGVPLFLWLLRKSA